MQPEDLVFGGIAELSRLLAAKTVSSLELAELFLARLERYGAAYGAVVTIVHERARREAKRADRERAAGRVRGPLHGIPYGVKDLLATPDAPTTWGAAPYRTQRFDFDATVVRRLSDAGAVLLAKLAMVELAGGFGYDTADASFTGPGRSPWNARFWSGGSSSGPGAAVSAGLVPFAIGSETSGSILTPSAYCGVTGLRPTYGRVSRHGAMALCWTLDKLGPMARSAHDAGVVLQAIAGADGADPTAVDRPFEPLRRKPRVAVVRDAISAGTMPGVARNFLASLRVLRQFCTVQTDVPFPRAPWGPAVGTIVAAEGAAAFRDLVETGRARELRTHSDRIGGFSAYNTLAVDYLDALRRRPEMIAALQRAFAGYDAVVTPTRATVAYPVGVRFADAYPAYGAAPPTIAAGNLAGLPAISVPNGFAEDGLPTGLAFMGPAFGEAALVELAARYQAATSFHTRRPVLHAEIPA